MSEEERTEKFKIIFEKTLTKLAENPDEFFDNDKLQKKYNELLKEKIKYKKEIERLTNQNKSLNEVYELTKENYIKLRERIEKTIERLQDYDLVEDKEKVIDDTFDILRGEKSE